MITFFQIWSRDKKKGYDVKNIVANLKWVTDLNFSAGQLNFDLVYQGKTYLPALGSIVKFYWDHHKVFYGYVFNAKLKHDKTVSVVAYDKTRYLKNQDSIVWKTGTIADRFTNVCKRAGINHKVINKPKHKVAAEVCDGKSYFDMLKSAISKTLRATGHMYFIYANYSRVELCRAPRKKLKLILDPDSGMTSFTFSKDIDNTANVVKIIQKNVKKSKSKTATASGDDPSKTSFKAVTKKMPSVKRWGKLQITQNKKSKANHAQMVKQAKNVLKQKDLANKTLTVDCIGNLDLVAGNSVEVKIVGYKTIKNCGILKATHNFSTDYNCSLEMKVMASWLVNDSTE
ncbi:late control protein D [Lactobacillus sp. ESL0679]|uniref:XkdQ/YqbQ family protein n=1 Tax=unclassified Lactobacillus TaxID=2620435 RepID=UPI0023F7252F|nr:MULTISPECIES: late control protein D [unclassified Lactobacillus]MDF7683640.1 late control protein D [Lactobacillus sp. ESL0679]WEV37737.1 late control protein D [Lactobacillus sp. ESL0677]